MSESNRRRHPRVKATKVVAHLRGEGRTLSCTVENISVGGVFVRSSERFEPGVRLQLTLVRPGMRKAPALTAVVMSALAVPGLVGMGLQFDPPAGEDAERLHKLLEELGVPSQPPPAPARAAAPAREEPAVELPLESQRLMVQIQGLMQQLGETTEEVVRLKAQLAAVTFERDRLKNENTELRVLTGRR